MKHKKLRKHVFLLCCMALLPIGLSASVTPTKHQAQGYATSSRYINFEDDNVKALCLAYWDTDGDSELSYDEAAAVTSLGNAFRSNLSITSFNELRYFTGLTSIGDEEFYSCHRLTSITIPNNVTSIGDRAFFFCVSLTSITIPNSVKSIGDDAFISCLKLTSVISKIEVPFEFGFNAFEDIAYKDKCILTVPYGTRDAYIAAGWTEDVFKGGVVENKLIDFACASVKDFCVINWDTDRDRELSYDEAAAVTSLGNVFRFNPSITSFNELRYFTGLTSIGDEEFYSCHRLTSITIPNNVTSIGDRAFFYCVSLTSITIPNNVTSIGNETFYCCGLTSITIPNSVTSIGGGAFRDCELTSVVSLIETPFAFGTDAFDIRPRDCMLTVPYGTRDAYIAAGWTEDIFKGGVVEKTTVKIVMATSSGEKREAIGYSSKYGFDFTGITDVNAYIASGYTENGEVLLSRVTIVPPRTGLFITTENPGVAVDVPITERDVFYANMLLPVVEAQTIEPSVVKDEVTYYTFAVGVLENSDEIGFVRMNEPTEMGPNKSILRVPASYYTAEAHSLGGFKIEFVDDTTTDLKQIITNTTKEEDCYDLQGRKVAKRDRAKGIYIINGKKVFIQ